MYTSTYSSSSPVRTSTFGIGSRNNQDQTANKLHYNSYDTMDDGNSSLKRTNRTYSNSQSSLLTAPIRKYPLNDFNTNKYQTTASYRSYSNEDLINNNPSPLYNSTSHNNNNNNNNSNMYGQQNRIDYYDDDLLVKSTDLSATNEQEMLELVRLAFRKYDLNNQRELAGFLKRSADKTFSSCWHCIVGRQFSSYVTHEMNGFIYLTKGPLSILLFKSGT